MGKFIKYERIVKSFSIKENNKDEVNDEIQKFFDYLITVGYEIIWYNEKMLPVNNPNDLMVLTLTVVVGKKNEYNYL